MLSFAGDLSMRRGSGPIWIGLLLVASAAQAPGACPITKGLYDQWLALARQADGHKGLKGALLRSSPIAPDAAKQQAINEEYQSYFRCLSETPAKLEEQDVESFCDPAAGDRLGLLVCQGVRHVKTGRTSSKDFINAFPSGRKAGEMVWDLEEIAGPKETARLGATFEPEGPALKLIDELFLLLLDDKESAAAKYFSIASTATGAGAKHMDRQIKVLLAESPAVVVQEWPTLRQYLPTLKRLLGEMAASLPKAEMLKIRKQARDFCPQDNLDCPEILKLFGNPE
jgi:hypothetical protein